MIIPGVDTKALASQASAWYKDRKNERLIKERIWNEAYLAYEAKFGETWADLEDYRSKRYLSLPWQAVETVSASYLNGVMPNEDFFETLGRTPDDDLRAKLMQSLLKWQHFKVDLRGAVKEAIKAVCITGNVPYCVDWKETLLDLPDQDAFAAQMAHNQMMSQMGVALPEEAQTKGFPTKQVRSYDGPCLRIGNIFDYVQDLRPSNPEFAMRGMRFFRSKAYLQANSQPDSNGYALYENIDQLSDENVLKESSDSLQMTREREIGIARLPEDMVELIQYEGDLELSDGSFYKNHILVVANRTTVIRFEPNPFYYGKPTWNLFTLFPEPNELYGRGLVEPVLGINDGIQVRYNQVLEANALAINPAFKYKEDGVFDPEEFYTIPGGLNRMADPNNLQPLVVPDQSALGFKEIDFAINQFNLITGAQENFGDVSATQVSVQAGMSQNRIKETLNHITHAFIMDVIEREIALNQQLMDEPTWIRVTSPMTEAPMPPMQLKVSPEDIVGQFDVYPIGAQEIARDRQRAQDLFQLTTAIAQSPFASVIKGPQFVNEIYKMGGYNDAWKFIKSPEDLAYEQAIAAQSQGIPGQAPGLAGPQPGGPGRGSGNPPAISQQPRPGGLPSLPGVSEGPGELPGGPNPAQLAGNRLNP